MNNPKKLDQISLDKGIELIEYCAKEYGLENAHFIMTRLILAVPTYSIVDLRSMADKIALFNNWTTLEKIRNKIN